MNHSDNTDCDDLSDDDSNFDLLSSSCQDEVTAQLAAAG